MLNLVHGKATLIVKEDMMRYAAIIIVVIFALTMSIQHIHAEGNNTDGEKIYPEKVEKNENITVRRDEASVAKGEKLFAGLCKKCHDAHSTAAVIGPGLKGVLKNELLPDSKKPATAENILNQLNGPMGKMPSFHWISAEDKLNIIAFLNTL